jgi:hypothetical protein
MATKTTPNRVVYKVLDGHEIDADVYLPSSSADQRDAGHPVSKCVRSQIAELPVVYTC